MKIEFKVFLWLMCAACCFLKIEANAATLPAVPPVSYQIIDNLIYSGTSAAIAAWPASSGNAAVATTLVSGRQTLRMPCNFSGTTFTRASWDHSLSLNLTSYAGLQFQIYCANAAPISKFNIYLHSGSGWYRGTFAPASSTAWTTVQISNANLVNEGGAGSLGSIDMIRICAWRGTNVTTQFYIANLGYVPALPPPPPPPPPPVVIPAVPSVNYQPFDTLIYTGAAQAQAAWLAANGVSPATVVSASGRQTLELPCNFSNASVSAAAWNHSLSLDMTNNPGIQFQFYSPDASPVSQFTLSLHNGSGWYTANFNQTTTDNWTTVQINKSDMAVQGTPGDWAGIDTISVSATRAKNQDALICLANLGLIPAPPVVIPAVPSVNYAVIDSLVYTDAAQAQAAWQATNGNAAATALSVSGRQTLGLPCNFSSAALTSAGWNHTLTLDMTNNPGIQFQFYCPDASPVSQFTISLHSGAGWYAANFNQMTTATWTTVQLNKTAMSPQGTPGTWAAIDAIRISATRLKNQDALICLANLGLIPPPPGVTPAVPTPAYQVVDALTYATTAAANTAWPASTGNAASSVVTVSGRQVLQLPCNFGATTIQRASWDHSLNLDLTNSNGIQFQFYTPDASPVSMFNIYLHCGTGWYSAEFGQLTTATWTTSVINKTDMTNEGATGWIVDRIRISAWRGKNQDTKIYVANLGLIAASTAVPQIAIIRADSLIAANPGESASVNTFGSSVAEALNAIGLAYATVSDHDLGTSKMNGIKIAILPYNPSMNTTVSNSLIQFLQGGGKILSFYNALSAPLAQAVGFKTGSYIGASSVGGFASIRPNGASGLNGEPSITGQVSNSIQHADAIAGQSSVAALWYNTAGASTGEPAILVSSKAAHMTYVLLMDDLVNKQELLLSMLGYLYLPLWQQTAQAAQQNVGCFGFYTGYDSAWNGIYQTGAQNPAVITLLNSAKSAFNSAVTLMAGNDYAGATTQFVSSNNSLLRAFYLAQNSQAGEKRLFWCHNPYGAASMNWDATIKTLADNGFTGCIANMAWADSAYYNSAVLPVSSSSDQIVPYLAACRKYGIECHVWKVNWNMGDSASAFAKQMLAAARTQVDYYGNPYSSWLCPSNPLNQQLEINAMVELATKYDIDGIHFDYIRYPGPDHCFCSGCRARFEQSIGHAVTNWPSDTRTNATLQQQWLNWRRGNINTVIAGVNSQVRAAKPRMKISAAVFPKWMVDRDDEGQDWKAWCDNGFMDFVCPMDYTPFALQYENLAAQQRAWAGKAGCYPGIGLSVWSKRGDAVSLIDFINASRRQNTNGFTVFQLDDPYAPGLLPLLRLGLTK